MKDIGSPFYGAGFYLTLNNIHPNPCFFIIRQNPQFFNYIRNTMMKMACSTFNILIHGRNLLNKNHRYPTNNNLLLNKESRSSQK